MKKHVKIFNNPDTQTLQQFWQVMKNAEMGALMADAHLGYVMPIGGVAAYKNKVSPVGVGFDIACGNLAIKLDRKNDKINLKKLLNMIQQEIAFGIGQTNPYAPKNAPIFEDKDWEAYPTTKIKDRLKKLARDQIGTVGGGNHYIDVFKDEEGWIWIGVHFGSRGLGYKTAAGFINLSLGRNWDSQPIEKEVLLSLDSELGKRYWKAIRLCKKYAYLGRRWVCKRIAERADAKIVESVHNNHNFAWKEKHFGKEYIIVRKGATPAFPGQKSFIGGSMGDNAFIVEGVESKESKQALYSTVHGAGRIMSRREAKRTLNQKMIEEWLKERGIELRGGGLDEAPHAYRRLVDVLGFHKKTIKILHTLIPLGVVMAGAGEFDPYKD